MLITGKFDRGDAFMYSTSFAVAWTKRDVMPACQATRCTNICISGTSSITPRCVRLASTIYRINFKPRKEVENPILSGNVFIDSSTLELKRFEGEVINHILVITDNSNGNKERIKDSKTYFSINYKTMKGASFVEYVAVDMRCTTKALGKINVHSVMYNVGDEVSRRTKQLGKNSDLLSKIDRQKYDPSYWKEKTIIKRTPLEKSVTEMFERENLFGTYIFDE